MKNTVILPPKVQAFLHSSREKEQKIVLVTGVFDLLHQEHILFLKKAKEEGDVLLIGIESDTRVREGKGSARPVNSEKTRQAHLEKLKLAEVVFILPQDFGKPEVRELFMSQIRPDVLAISSHSPFQEEKRRLAAKYGGVLKVVYQHNPAVSTSKLIEKE